MTDPIQDITALEYEFLNHSNMIEGEYSKEAMEDTINAWQYMKNTRTPMFSFESVMHTHELLMRRLRPDIAGKLRNCDVWVGGSKRIFISQALLEEEIRDVCMSIIHSEMRDEYCDTNIVKKLHVEFEHIHPFEDGNGRTGRIVMNAHRIRLGLPILVIREEEKHEYYKWFE